MNENLRNKFNFEKILIYLAYSIVFFSIAGPAIPDIIATIAAIYCIYKLFKQRLFTENFIILTFSFILLLIPNFFSSFFPLPFIEQLINIRYFLFALFIASLTQLRLKIIIQMMLFSTLIISFDLMYQYIFKVNIIGIPINPGHNLGRASSFFGDELIAGTYILKFSLPIIGYYLFHKKYIFTFLLVNIYIIAIIFSGERMAFLLYCLGIFIFAFVIRDVKKILILGMSLLIISISSYFIFDGAKVRFDSFITTIGLKEEKFQDFGHAAHFMTALEIYKNNKIFGSGHKTFRVECNRDEIKNKINSKSSGCATHPHNNYLEVLSDSGIIGFIGFLFFLIFIISKSLKSNLLRTEACGFFISALIIFWPISSMGNFFNNRTAIINFFIFGIILLFSKKNIFFKNKVNKI